MLGLNNPLHIAVVLIVVLLVFGAKRLPELGSSLGEGLRGFKASVTADPSEPATKLAELNPAQVAPPAAVVSTPVAPPTAIVATDILPTAVVSESVPVRSAA